MGLRHTALGAATAAGLFGHVQAAAAMDAVTFQLDWLPGGDKAPIFVCVDQGFCEDAGLDVSIEQGRGSSEAITKLATGVSDIGLSGMGALMAARANEDVPVTAVMSVFNKGPHAFFTLKGSGIESVADVNGATIATSPFTSSNVYLPLVLEEVGLSQDDITLEKADPGALGPMLATGSVDGIIAWLTNVSRFTGQVERAGETLVTLPWSDAGLALYSAALVASDSFLEERPDVARRFVEAFARSVAFIEDNPEAAAESVANVVPELGQGDVAGPLDDMMALVFNEVTEADGLGALTPERLSATWERVSEAQGLDPKSLDPESVVDRSFLPGTM